ncbi:MAG: hypothetical protein L6R35_001721 [Caloplaca aegaea]|nr:MAG: hypothetical protein L6R35_001721 [Caloplaca aegaea]
MEKLISVMSHRNSHIEHLMTDPVLTRDIHRLVSLDGTLFEEDKYLSTVDLSSSSLSQHISV